MTAGKRTTSGVSPLHLWGIWLIGTVVATAPLLITSIPPLGQHFYNIVRVDILAHPASYAGNFVVRWDVLPDLAMDLTVPWLTKFMPVERAASLFVIVVFGLLTSGCLMLSRVVNGRWSWFPLTSFLLLYNWILIRGYDNNLFGLGVCLWAIALHVALRGAPVARIVVSSCSALVIYFRTGHRHLGTRLPPSGEDVAESFARSSCGREPRSVGASRYAVGAQQYRRTSRVYRLWTFSYIREDQSMHRRFCGGQFRGRRGDIGKFGLNLSRWHFIEMVDVQA
jgi:hypothetical protein